MATDVNEMTCKELVELVTDYLEGALSPMERERFEVHISKCDWCKIYIDQMRLTIQTLGQLSEEFLPPQAREELLHVFRDWKKS
jgi:predicted anti-sigma-YlaC factor YlaD